MTAMILAAGRGERLRPLTDRVPKPLVVIAGRSLLERHLDRIAKTRTQRVVINLGWQGEQIVDRVGSGDAYGLTVSYSPEYDHVLETGGGLRRALPMLGSEPFWVLNGDIYTDFELREPALPAGVMGHLVLVTCPPHRQGGDFALVGGQVRNGPQPELVFSGMACYRPEFIERLPAERGSIVPLLREAADAGELSGEIHAGDWEDVGTLERLEALNRRLASD